MTTPKQIEGTRRRLQVRLPRLRASHVFKVERGLTADSSRQISANKNEPEWMREFRLKALEIFRKKPMPGLGRRPLRASTSRTSTTT